MKYRYYWWESEDNTGQAVHLGAIARTEFEAKWAILRKLACEFEHGEIDKEPLEGEPNVQEIDNSVLVFSGGGV